ncbi:MAG: DUF1579 domain-containing protein [Rhodospirillaceae bacterium]|nr:DUF1579 domain-containing protein [Rhodospirillaceae bacterium]
MLMNRIAKCAIGFAFLAAPAIAMAQTPSAPSPITVPDELKHMAFLAGSCWQGPFPDGKSIDSHCYKWFQRGRYLRERHEVIGSNPPYGGETTFYWDHDAKAVRYIYWANNGGYATGSSIIENGAVKYPDERYIGPDGEFLVRAEMKQIDDNSYTMRADMKGKDGKWVEFVNATYTRKPLNW